MICVWYCKNLRSNFIINLSFIQNWTKKKKNLFKVEVLTITVKCRAEVFLASHWRKQCMYYSNINGSFCIYSRDLKVHIPFGNVIIIVQAFIRETITYIEPNLSACALKNGFKNWVGLHVVKNRRNGSKC